MHFPLLANASTEQLFQHAAVPMLLIAPDSGKILLANSAAMQFYGYDLQTLQTLSIFHLNTLPEGAVREEMRFAKANQKNSFRFEHRLANGEKRQVDVSSVPLNDEPNSPLFSIIHDISEFLSLKERETMIQETLEKHYHLLHTVLNATHKQALMVVNRDGTIKLVNKPAEHTIGLTPIQITGKPFPEALFSDEVITQLYTLLTLPPQPALAWEVIFQQLRYQSTLSLRGRIFPCHQQSFRAEISLNTLTDANGEVEGLLLLIENVETEEQAAEKLKLAASVFSEASEGIIITGTDAQILDVNQAFCDITGYSKQELIGQNPRLLKSGHQDQNFYQHMWQTLAETGHWYGELWNRRKNGQVYAEELTISAVRNDHGQISHYIGLLSDITDRKHQQATIEHLAYYDALTQLPNRILLGDRMRQALAQNSRGHGLIAVCYLDLDGFKPVNDKHGHKTGDLLLIEVAKRLQESVRTHDTVARLGGDEFVIVMTDINSAEETDRILHRILHTLHRNFKLDHHPDIHIGASIGVAHFPLDGLDADTLLRHADQAMYQAKEAGRDTVHYFNPAQEEQIQQHHQFRNEIRHALDVDAFSLHWQPWINLETRQIQGYEGLLRWVKDNRNIWLPATFLNRLQNDNLLIAVGNRVLEQAYAALAHAKQQGIRHTISLNISLRHWLGNTFISKLTQLQDKYLSVEPGQLYLEINETELIEHLEALRPVIRRAKSIGLGIIIDGFGSATGPKADFAYLTLADQVKLTPYLLHDMLDNEQALAQVQMLHLACQKRKIPVIAKQLELIEQIVLLQRLHIHLGQGYVISPIIAELPLNADQQPAIDIETPASHSDWPIEDSALATSIPEHRRWLHKLEKLIHDGTPLPYLRGNVLDCCRLGDWMQSKGQRWSHLPDFQQLDQQHQHFRQLINDSLSAMKSTPRNLHSILQQAETVLQDMDESVDHLLNDIINNSKSPD